MGGWNSESHLGAGVYVTKRRNNRRGTHHSSRVARGSKTLRTTWDSRRHRNAKDTHPRWTSPRHAPPAHNHIRRGHPARVLSRITPFCTSEWIHLDIVESTHTDAKTLDSSTRPGELLAHEHHVYRMRDCTSALLATSSRVRPPQSEDSLYWMYVHSSHYHQFAKEIGAWRWGKIRSRPRIRDEKEGLSTTDLNVRTRSEPAVIDYYCNRLQ